MPLLDHFHPPLSLHRHWQGFHSAWANAMVRQLNDGLLPARFHAEPSIQLGGQVEIDVPTFEETTVSDAIGNGVSTIAWAPPQPLLSAPVDFSQLDIFEVRVLFDEGGYRLAAAIELISPANKDRPTSRRAFAAKCANYLQSRVGVIVIDVVTERPANLHHELLAVMNMPGSTLAWQSESNLSAIAYRTQDNSDGAVVGCWPIALAVGSTLPTLPLWIAADCPIPLELEKSYQASCHSLRIAD